LPPPWLTLAICAVATLLVAPAAASAHVKWFVDPRPYPLRTDLILSGRTALFVAVAVVALGLLFLLSRFLRDPLWPRLPFLDRMAIGAPTLLATQTAITLIHNGVQPILFAPNLPLGLDPLGLSLAVLQVLVAFTFITGLLDWVGALALILLGPLAFALYPPWDVFEQLLLAGIGLVILVIGRWATTPDEVRPWFRRRWPRAGSQAVTALRILSGISVVALALGEKLWNPDLGAAFLAEYPHFNIFRTFGLAPITDDQFVLLAGLVEGTIGVLLVSGLLTRVVVLFMWVPFNLGAPFLPPQELLGHLPIFGIMYLLLVSGQWASSADH
jgi:hypothetical protein